MTDQIQPLVHVMAQLVRPRSGHRHVFTYDGLMAEDRIRELCPDLRFVIKRCLKGHAGLRALGAFELMSLCWFHNQPPICKAVTP